MPEPDRIDGSMVGGLAQLRAACVFALVLATGCQQTPWHREKKTNTPEDKLAVRPQMTPDQSADVKVALAQSLEQQGELTPAIDLYQQVLKQAPKRVDAMTRLAVLHDQRGEFNASAPLYQKALKSHPNDPDLLCNRGYSLYLQGRFPEAESSLRQAIARNPDHARAHNNLGLLLGRTGHPSESIQEFAKAGCGSADAHLNLAFALTLERRWNDARAQYQLALASDPKSERAKNGLRNLEILAQKEPGKSTTAKRDDATLQATFNAPRTK